jgi:valyl-tRNA synthetase
LFAEEKQLPIEPTKDKPVNACSKCGSKEYVPETDVLNTWFTSSLTPTIATNLVEQNIRKELFPMDLRPQAHEIITFWLFNTLVKSRLHYGINPWKDVAISGFVTLEGEKMSKSKGNVIRPQEVLEKYGADAIRYWAASSKMGEDVDYQEKDVVTGKKFVTKILNATNFVFANLEYQKKVPDLCKTDKIFLGELNKLINTTTIAFERYNYSRAKSETDNFFWKTLCDNYLEIVKQRVYNGSEEEKKSAFYTLYISLLTVLKLMAPFTPFITEEIYQTYFRDKEGKESVHLENWPKVFKIKEEENDSKIWNKFLEILSFVRQKKSEEKKSMKSEIELIVPKGDLVLLDEVLDDLKAVANAVKISEGKFEIKVL